MYLVFKNKLVFTAHDNQVTSKSKRKQPSCWHAFSAAAHVQTKTIYYNINLSNERIGIIQSTVELSIVDLSI